MKKILAAGAVLAASLCVATTASASTPMDTTTSPQYVSNQSFDDTNNGDTVSSSQNVDWRVESHADGSSVVIAGPGSLTVPVDSTADSYTTSQQYQKDSGAISSGAVTPAAGNGWYCVFEAPDILSWDPPSYLKSYVDAYCEGGRPGSMRINYWADHDSWLGWKQWAPGRYTSWTASQAQGTDVYYRCNVSGDYNYRMKVKGNVENAGATYSFPSGSGPHSSDSKHKCGTSAG